MLEKGHLLRMYRSVYRGLSGKEQAIAPIKHAIAFKTIHLISPHTRKGPFHRMTPLTVLLSLCSEHDPSD
ncbi:MAG: hypothetical protein J7L44_01720 [Candidatus Diapherotrites archaeon]|nr:hypothetical protein [Candidatus Diapherotrites archaeon]